jgi:uncharacterized damage-inducible protein DinB
MARKMSAKTARDAAGERTRSKPGARASSDGAPARAKSKRSSVDAAVASPAAAAPRKRGKPPVDLGAALLHAFATHERVNQYLLEHLEPSIWASEAPVGKGRTIRAIVAHLHNVRHMWLVVSEPDLPAPPKVDRHSLTLDEARAALAASGRAMLELVARALENGGRVRDFKPDVAGFVGYAISHEAHHRGQICMLARLLGSPLPQNVGFGMWEWRKRGDEVAPDEEPAG